MTLGHWLAACLPLLLLACGQSSADAPSGGGGGGGAGVKGIGPDSKWQVGVEAHVAGPYRPCGEIGTGELSWVAASPSAATQIAIASRAGLVLFFSSEDGSSLRPTFHADWPVWSVDYSRDGQQLVVAGDGGVEILNLADGSVSFRNKPFDFATTAAALSPDGSVLAALGTDIAPTDEHVVLRLIRVADGARVAELADRDGRPYVPPQFSPDGKAVLVGTTYASIPDLQINFFPPRGNYAATTALSPDGKLLAGSGEVWDIGSQQKVKRAESLSPTWVAFSPDGKTYAESFMESGITLHLYRTADWSEITLPTTTYGQLLPTEIPDGRFFFARDGKRLFVTLQPYGTDPTPDRSMLRVVNLPDLTIQTVIARTELAFAAPAISPDGSLIAAHLTAKGGVWRSSDLSPISRFGEGFPSPLWFLSNGMLIADLSQTYDPNTGLLVNGDLSYWQGVSSDGTMAVLPWGIPLPRREIVRLSDLTTISTLRGPISGDTEWAFSSDKRYLAALHDGVTEPDTLRVFEISTGKLVSTLAGASPFAIGVSNGAVRLVGKATDTSRMRVWSIPDGAPLLDLDDAGAVAFSPEGSLIAVGQDLIHIYRSDTGALRQSFFAHGDGPVKASPRVFSVAFGATGQLVSVGGRDGTLRVWCSP